MSTLEERVTHLETSMSDIQATLAQVAQLQLANTQQLNENAQQLNKLTLDVAANTQQLNKLTADVASMDQWVKTFAFEAQRLFTRIGGTAEKNEVALDSLHQTVTRLTNNAEIDRAEARQDRAEMSSLISRMDALINYLMRRDGGDD